MVWCNVMNRLALSAALWAALLTQCQQYDLNTIITSAVSRNRLGNIWDSISGRRAVEYYCWFSDESVHNQTCQGHCWVHHNDPWQRVAWGCSVLCAHSFTALGTPSQSKTNRQRIFVGGHQCIVMWGANLSDTISLFVWRHQPDHEALPMSHTPNLTFELLMRLSELACEPQSATHTLRVSLQSRGARISSTGYSWPLLTGISMSHVWYAASLTLSDTTLSKTSTSARVRMFILWRYI